MVLTKKEQIAKDRKANAAASLKEVKAEMLGLEKQVAASLRSHESLAAKAEKRTIKLQGMAANLEAKL